METKLEKLRHPLVDHLYSLFEQARMPKQKINERIIRNLKYYMNKFTDEELAKLKEKSLPPIFLPLINIKVRALKSWLSDIYFADPSEPPFDIQPTPISDAKQKLIEQILANQLEGIGAIPDITLQIEMIEQIRQKAEEEAERILKEMAEKEKKKLLDQLIEGNFFQALDQLLLDVAIYPSAILKFTNKLVRRFISSTEVIDDVIPYFSRVSPLDIYPSPNVSDTSDYIFEILHLLPQDLATLRTIEGYNTKGIDRILEQYGETGYTVVLTDTRRIEVENKSYDRKTIDVLEFWGTIKGDLLKDFFPDVSEDEYYDVNILLCDDYIIKATLNPHPLKWKPYFKVSFIEVPDSFWGLSLVDVLVDIQRSVNNLYIHSLVNSAFSSGPMIERNIDRVPQDSPKVIEPWVVFDSHDVAISNAPAYRFYQPNFIANAILPLVQHAIQLSHELSGVPPYAHAVPTGSGSLRTSSGLAMLLESSSRGIKDVVRNIDRNIIETIIKYLYYENLLNYGEKGLNILDLNIRAEGSSILANKVAQAQKVMQLLQITSNPIDLQLVGLEARRDLLVSLFKSFGVDVPIQEIDTNALMQQIQQQSQKGKKQVQMPPEYTTLANELQAEQTQQTQKGGMII